MTDIHEAKMNEVTGTPLVLFECSFASGHVERWSTHRISHEGTEFTARVLRHNLLEFAAGGDDAIDAVSRVKLTLANSDSYFSQLQRSHGFKGAKLTARFCFADVQTRTSSTNSVVLFQGVCDPPDEIRDDAVRLSFSSRLSLQRIFLPEVRIQRRCPWIFPETAEQRSEAAEGGAEGRYSAFYRCGYSPDVEGGCGNNGTGGPYTSCDYTRASCQERGMFDRDASGQVTARYGGMSFVPSSILVRPHGESARQVSAAIENEARYNEFAPLVYGTAWYRPPVIFARSDGNLTRTEVLLGSGPVEGVLKVIANGVELPEGSQAPQATATGWYNVVSLGTRHGGFNLDFTNGAGEPAGEPHGSMAVLSVVVPNHLVNGSALPRVEVLLRGQVLPTVLADGAAGPETFSNNPAWVLLDVLRRSGWKESELDLSSFASAAAYCAEPVEMTDPNGELRLTPRFGCNLVLRQRRSAAEVVRGVRTAAALSLGYGRDGRLTLSADSTLAIQQPSKPAGTNAAETLNGGWPAYEFGDGSSGFGDILRTASGESSIRLMSRSSAESPNRVSVEFQDEFNEYQQDSLSLVDVPDRTSGGHEVSVTMPALGIPNFNQAARILRLALDRSVRGNTYAEFETGLRGLGLKPGDLITLTYRRHGLQRQPFRITRVQPGTNCSTARITAQIHDDGWYQGEAGLNGGGRQPAAEPGVPRPVAGTAFDSQGDTQYSVEEVYTERTDGAWEVQLSVGFNAPARPGRAAAGVPILRLDAGIKAGAGTLAGGRTYYYAVSGVHGDGSETALSFLVRAVAPAESGACAIRLEGISLPPGCAAFHVYRGLSPAALFRIASQQPASRTFTDSGESQTATPPPDGNYHHANFHWRLELLPETQCTSWGETSLGNSSLSLTPGELRSKRLRITRGRGKGQERAVVDNTADAIQVASPFAPVPDATSSFAVCEPAWNFGASTEQSPAVFSVPNRHGATLHISGRAANAADRECAWEISPLTRHRIGGAAADADVAETPVFGLHSSGDGYLEIAAIGFNSLENTAGITGATLFLHYRDELAGVHDGELASAAEPAQTELSLSAAIGAEEGDVLQVEDELMTVSGVSADGRTLSVTRGELGSDASAHASGAAVVRLQRRTVILPFPRRFFGTPASGNYTHLLAFPHVRIAAAQMFVTNSRGNSQTAARHYLQTSGRGIRTLSGGQYTLQVSGPLAVQATAVPPVAAESSKPVRDVYATVMEAPEGAPVTVRVTAGGQTLCELTIPANAKVSDVVDGGTLPALQAGTAIGLDIVSTGLASAGRPGADLTVTIRT